MMTTNDPLLECGDRLEEAIAAEIPGREPAWAEQVGNALAGLQVALRQHTAGAEEPDGMYSHVDLTRPTLTRQVGDLRQEHKDFLQRAALLEKHIGSAAEPFASRADTITATSPLPEPAAVRAIPDFGDLRQRGEQFIRALRRHLEQENDLVLESVTTEIGVGD